MSQRNFPRLRPRTRRFSNGLEALFEVTQRQWGRRDPVPTTNFSAPAGPCWTRVAHEHQCEGWLEGYLLTGTDGIFNCLRAFIHIIDSMFKQHAKWLR